MQGALGHLNCRSSRVCKGTKSYQLDSGSTIICVELKIRFARHIVKSPPKRHPLASICRVMSLEPSGSRFPLCLFCKYSDLSRCFEHTFYSSRNDEKFVCLPDGHPYEYNNFVSPSRTICSPRFRPRFELMLCVWLLTPSVRLRKAARNIYLFRRCCFYRGFAQWDVTRWTKESLGPKPSKSMENFFSLFYTPSMLYPVSCVSQRQKGAVCTVVWVFQRRPPCSSWPHVMFPPVGTAGKLTKTVTWLILPVVICLSQRLSHACLSINNFIL
jgi:hypothetical protein